MEVEGAAYLYALAAAAMAFVGFSTIVIILRQTLGTGLSRFQILLTRVLIEHGFVVVLFCFLPLLLATFHLAHAVIWRASSASAAIFVAAWMLDYALRRHPAASERRLPLFAWVNYAVTLVMVVALVANAFSYPAAPQVGPYAAAMSWMLFQGVDIFILSLKAFLHSEKKSARP